MQGFDRIKIRVAAIIRSGDAILLMRRHKNGVDSYTLPGGNVDDAEDIEAALRRELYEELGLDTKLHPLRFVAIQDQMVSRPGETPPPRKLHVIFDLIITNETASKLATEEQDEIGKAHMVWVALKYVASLHLYPAVGGYLEKAISGLTTPSLLPAMTDESFVWR